MPIAVNQKETKEVGMGARDGTERSFGLQTITEGFREGKRSIGVEALTKFQKSEKERVESEK